MGTIKLNVETPVHWNHWNKYRNSSNWRQSEFQLSATRKNTEDDRQPSIQWLRNLLSYFFWPANLKLADKIIFYLHFLNWHKLHYWYKVCMHPSHLPSLSYLLNYDFACCLLLLSVACRVSCFMWRPVILLSHLPMSFSFLFFLFLQFFKFLNVINVINRAILWLE